MFALAIRLQDVFKTFSRLLQDVFKMFFQEAVKTSWKNVFKTSSRRLQDVLKTSLRRLVKTSSMRPQNVFKTSGKNVFKTSSRHLQDDLQRYLQDVFKTYHQVKVYLLPSLRYVFNALLRRTAKTVIYCRICLGHSSQEFMVSVQNLQES